MEQTVKDPVGIGYITLDLSEWLLPEEEVTTFSSSSTPGITVDADSISDDKRKVTVRVVGGTLYDTYKVSFVWETTLPRKDKWSIIISMENK